MHTWQGYIYSRNESRRIPGGQRAGRLLVTTAAVIVTIAIMIIRVYDNGSSIDSLCLVLFPSALLLFLLLFLRSLLAAPKMRLGSSGTPVLFPTAHMRFPFFSSEGTEHNLIHRAMNSIRQIIYSVRLG